jgi:hypothetical protein
VLWRSLILSPEKPVTLIYSYVVSRGDASLRGHLGISDIWLSQMGLGCAGI